MLGELFTIAGSFAGLFSAGFLIWDRLVKDRPSAYLDPRPPAGYRGGGNDLLLVLHNPARRPIFVDLPPDHSFGFGFVTGDEIVDHVEAALRQENEIGLRVTIPAGKTVTVEITRPTSNAPDRIRLVLDWRPAHHPRWDLARWLRRPLVLTTTIDDMKEMRGQTLAEREKQLRA